MSQLEGCDVEVVEARHLIAADKGGTSDPFAQVLLIDADGKEVPKESFKTKTWKKTLTPQWRESFKLGDDTLPSVLVNSFIEVRVFDEDKGFGASNDPLGVVRFPLKLLARKSKLKFDAWFTLEPTPAMQTKGATVEPRSLGEVRLKGRLLGNAPGIFAELKESAQALGEQWPGMKDAKDDAGVDEVHALKFKDFEPNELHVMLTRARDLPIMDTALLVGKGSSDPFVSLSVFGTTTKSTVKKKSLNPDWNESFVIPVDDLTAVLEVEMYDYDLLGDNDFMGRVSIPLRPCQDKLRHAEWHVLTDEQGVALVTAAGGGPFDPNKPGTGRAGRAGIELTLWWKYSPERAGLLSMELNDDVEDSKVDTAAMAEAEAARKVRRREARKAAALADAEESKRLATEALQHQYREELKSRADGAQDALRLRWEEANQQAEELHESARLKRELEEEEEGAAVATADFEGEFEGPDGEPAFVCWNTFKASKEQQRQLNRGSLMLSFDEWQLGLQMREIGAALKKLDVSNQTAEEFVAAYRSGRPSAEVSEVVNLLRKELRDADNNSSSSSSTNGSAVANNSHHNLGKLKGAAAIVGMKNLFGANGDHDGDGDHDDELDSDGGVDEEEDETERAARLRTPNELCVCLTRGRGLLAVDTTLMGRQGSSDPQVVLEVEGATATSKCVKKDLNPIWKEVLRLPIPLHVFGSQKMASRPNPAGGAAAGVLAVAGNQGALVAAAGAAGEVGGGGTVATGGEAGEEEEEELTLKCLVEDVDLVGANDFMGLVNISVSSLTKFWSEPKWFALGDEDHAAIVQGGDGGGSGGGTAAKDVGRGALELRLRVRHNPALLEPPLLAEATEFDDPSMEEPEEHKHLPPNELRVTLWRGRRLPVMDRSIFSGSKGGTSDPLVKFTCVGSSVTSTTKKKCLDPEWGESWSLKADAIDGMLEVVVEDYDFASGNDFMGKLTVPLGKLKHRRAVRRWYALGDKNGKRGGGGGGGGKSGGKQRGALDLQLRWVHNPKLVEPEMVLTDAQAVRMPKGERAKFAGKPRNELLVTVVQAKNLPIMDRSAFVGGGKGSSDPVVTLRIADGGDRAVTSIKKKNLNPTWLETFQLACPQDPDAMLELVMDDHDLVGSNDFMGKVNVPLNPLSAGLPHRAWYTLGAQRSGLPDGKTMRGSVELCMRWRHNPDLMEGDPLEEVDGDEWPDKQPNELRVGLIRCRKLPIMDKPSLGYSAGSSDPMVTFRVGNLNRVSPLKKKTLNPRWNWRCFLPAQLPASALAPAAAADTLVLDGGDDDEENNGGGVAAASSSSSSNKKDKKPKKSKKEKAQAKAYAKAMADQALEEKEAERRAGVVRLKPGLEQDLHLEVVVEDYNAGSENDFMGRAVVPFATSMAEELGNKKALRKWFALAPQESGPLLKPDVDKCGEVELLLKWCYNPNLDFGDLEKPYVHEEEEKKHKAAKAKGKDRDLSHFGKPPNELQFGLLSATDLAVMDKNLFTGQGSSDPVVVLKVGTNQSRSSVKAKQLNPEWNERLFVPADEFATQLEIIVMDDDGSSGGGAGSAAGRRGSQASRASIAGGGSDSGSRPGSSNGGGGGGGSKFDDFMGKAVLSVAELKDRQPIRRWFDLGDAKSGVVKIDPKTGKSTKGRVELIVRWVYNPDLEPPPLLLAPEETEEGLEEVTIKDLQRFGNRLPNELHVCVIRANGLPPMDKAKKAKGPQRGSIFGGKKKRTSTGGGELEEAELAASSDPFVKLSLPMAKDKRVSDVGATVVIGRDLSPVWESRFVTGPLPYASHHVLRCQVWDRDAVGTVASSLRLDGDDFMGQCDVPLVDLVNRYPKRAWFRLSDAKGAKAAAVAMAGASEGGDDDGDDDDAGVGNTGAGGHSGAGGGKSERKAPQGAGIAESPDFGRLELWLRYAYNPKYDPTWVDAPIVANAFTSTSADLPDILARLPPLMSNTTGSGMGHSIGCGGGDDDDDSGSSVWRPSGVETPRWFYLESPRRFDDDDDEEGCLFGGGGGMTPLSLVSPSSSVGDSSDLFDRIGGGPPPVPGMHIDHSFGIKGAGGEGGGGAIPHGPYNEAGLKELFEAQGIHNLTRVWTEGMSRGWTRIDEIPGLKRRLWAYPEPPAPSGPGDLAGAVSADEAAVMANQRWFFVDEHLGEGPGGAPGAREVVGPETAEELRERFESGGGGAAAAGGVGGGQAKKNADARVGDGTLAWREGLEDWVPLGLMAASEGVGRNAGWRPRREQRGLPLSGRFDLTMECCKCGGVATVHSIDALGLDTKNHHVAMNNAAILTDGAAEGLNRGAAAGSIQLGEVVPPSPQGVGEGAVGGGAVASERPLRPVVPSGRQEAKNSREDLREVLSDFLWVGTYASSRKNSLSRLPITHVINVTEDVDDALPARDMVAPVDGGSVVYRRLPLPDVVGKFEAEHGEGAWDEAYDDGEDYDEDDGDDGEGGGGNEFEGSASFLSGVGGGGSFTSAGMGGSFAEIQAGGGGSIGGSKGLGGGSFRGSLGSIGSVGAMLIMAENAEGGDDDGDDAEEAEERRRWEAIKAARKTCGPSVDEWLAVFDRAFEFAEAALRVDGAKARVLVHARRGTVRANLVAASYVLRKHGLRAAEALAHVGEKCPSMEGAEGEVNVVLAEKVSKPPVLLHYHEEDYDGDGIDELFGGSAAAASGSNNNNNTPMWNGAGQTGSGGSGGEGEAGAELAFAMAGVLPAGAAAALGVYEWRYGLGRLFCDECFDEYRFGEEDQAMSLVAEAAAGRLRRGDPEMVSLELRGEPLTSLPTPVAMGEGGPPPAVLSRDEAEKALSVVASLADAIATTHSPLLTLDLSGTGLGDAGLTELCRGLSKQTRVEFVTLQYNHIGCAGCEALGRMLAGSEAGGANHPLSHLDLAFNSIGAQGAAFLAKSLRANESLTSLHLNSNITMGDEGGKALAESLCNPDAEQYQKAAVVAAAAADKGGHKAGETAERAYLKLHRANAGLTHLNLCSTGLGQKSCAQLSEALSTSPTLVCLELSHNPNLGSAEVKALATTLRTKKPPTLEVLSIGQMVLGDDVAALFSKVLDPKADAMEADAANKRREEEEAQEEFRETGHRPTNPALLLNGSKPPVWVASTLKALHLPRNRLLSTSAKRLSFSLHHNSTLIHLSLPQNPLGPKGAGHLGEMLAVNRHLRRLDLEGCGFNEAAALALARGLKLNKGLEALELSENHLGAHGVRHIAAALEPTKSGSSSGSGESGGNSTLKSLKMDNVQAGIIGAEFFARALTSNQGLQVVSFANNHIRNVGAEAFAPCLFDNTNLVSVDLSFNEFNTSGAAPLLKALEATTEPGCSRDHKTLALHLDLTGNDGCDNLIAPHLARAKLRWDFLPATRRSRLATNPGAFPLARQLVDPKVKAAFALNPHNEPATQGGTW